MATADTISIDSSTNEVVLKDVRVQDAELVSYLSEYDSDDQEEAVSRALQIGASALQLVDTSTEAEIVEQRFAEMEREFEAELEELREELNDRFDEDDGQLLRILDDHFGDDGQLQTHLQEAFGSEGKFAERLEEQLGEDGEKIQEALDPQREGTPTHRLQQRIVSEIEKVKERFDKAEGKAEIRKKLHSKGTTLRSRSRTCSVTLSIRPRINSAIQAKRPAR